VASLLHFYRNYASQSKLSMVVFIYGLRRLDVCSCHECKHQSHSGVLYSTWAQYGKVSRLSLRNNSSRWTRSSGRLKFIFPGNDQRHSSPLWCFRFLASDAESTNVMTYNVSGKKLKSTTFFSWVSSNRSETLWLLAQRSRTLAFLAANCNFVFCLTCVVRCLYVVTSSRQGVFWQ